MTGPSDALPTFADAVEADAVEAEADQLPPLLASSPSRLEAGVRLTIRGRPMVLRRLRMPSAGPVGLLAIFGPGLIAANAGDDAGGIATYASVGAKYGYDLLWMMVLITVSLAIVQEIATRLGAATGRGLLDLVRERFGLGWSLLAVFVVLLANGGVIVTEFVGIGAALELFGISRYLGVPAAALLVWWLVVQGSYRRVEIVFLAMTLTFFAYPIAAILAGPDWGEVVVKTVVPDHPSRRPVPDAPPSRRSGRQTRRNMQLLPPILQPWKRGRPPASKYRAPKRRPKP